MIASNSCKKCPWTEQEEAQIVLGDRPIEITLERAWKALLFKERIDLILSFTRLAFERAGIKLGGSGAEVDDTEKVWTG